jgi:hypothetical protein
MLFTIIPGPLRRRGNGSPPTPYNFTRRVLGYAGQLLLHRMVYPQASRTRTATSSMRRFSTRSENAAGGLTAVKPVSSHGGIVLPGKGQPGDEG